MGEPDPRNLAEALGRIRAQASAQAIRITQHAHQEMVEDGVLLERLLEALKTGEIIENYPEHRRGPCCLIDGTTREGRHLHVACTTSLPVLVIITVYEPRPPKWPTPRQRAGR
jgi:hypothetical protein